MKGMTHLEDDQVGRGMTHNMSSDQLSNEKKPGCLGYIGDYTTQLYRDYNKPL